MSYEAIRWALTQQVPKSSAKFVLVAMANCVNGEGAEMLCWPSVKHLSEATSQDRKTVMDALQRLREWGFISDTGERKGITAQVPVYALKSPESGTVSATKEPPSKPVDTEQNSTENGTGTENGTVPDFPSNSTVFPAKQSQISLETVPKTGHGTSKEPVKNQEGTSKKRGGFDASSIGLPDWLEQDDWSRWCKDRKQRGKGITEDAARLQIKKLGDYRSDGFTPAEVIENSIANGYQGLFPPKRSAAKPVKTGSRYAGFREMDYSEGLTDGIPDA